MNRYTFGLEWDGGLFCLDLHAPCCIVGVIVIKGAIVLDMVSFYEYMIQSTAKVKVFIYYQCAYLS